MSTTTTPSSNLTLAVQNTYVNHLQSLLLSFPNNDCLSQELETIRAMDSVQVCTTMAQDLSAAIRPRLLKKEVFDGMWLLAIFARTNTKDLFYTIQPSDQSQFWQSVAGIVQAVTTWSVMKDNGLNSDIQMLSDTIKQQGTTNPMAIVQSMFANDSTRGKLLDIFANKDAVNDLLRNSSVLLEGWGIDMDQLSESMLPAVTEQLSLSSLSDGSDTNSEEGGGEDQDMSASSLWKHQRQGSKSSASITVVQPRPKFKELVEELASTNDGSTIDNGMLDCVSELLNSGVMESMLKAMPASR